MNKLKIPEGYQSITPYLIIENAGAFLNFMKAVFNAEEKSKVMRDEKLILHAEIIVAGSIIMFADATLQHGANAGSFFIYVGDCDAVYQKGLENGATSITEPGDQSYGRSAGIKDPFGTTWWLTSI